MRGPITPPRGTSRSTCSTSRAKYGMAAKDSGTAAATGPIEVPAMTRVNGTSATSRMMKERTARYSPSSSAAGAARAVQRLARPGTPARRAARPAGWTRTARSPASGRSGRSPRPARAAIARRYPASRHLFIGMGGSRMSSRPSAELRFTCAPVISACSSTRPFSITATWRHSARTTASSCVTMTMVTPSRRLMSRSTPSTERVVSGSSAEVGSSHSSTAGSLASASDGHALLLAAGQLRRMAGGLVRQPHDLQTLAPRGGDLFAVAAARAQREGDVLEHGLVLQQVELLEDHADARARSADLPRPVSSVPATHTPWSGRSSRLIRRSSVDLPAPLLPMMPKVSPRGSTATRRKTASKRPAGAEGFAHGVQPDHGLGHGGKRESVALWVIG